MGGTSGVGHELQQMDDQPRIGTENVNAPRSQTGVESDTIEHRSEPPRDVTQSSIQSESHEESRRKNNQSEGGLTPGALEAVHVSVGLEREPGRSVRKRKNATVVDEDVGAIENDPNDTMVVDTRGLGNGRGRARGRGRGRGGGRG